MKIKPIRTGLFMLALILLLGFSFIMAFTKYGVPDRIASAHSVPATDAQHCAPEKAPVCVMKTIFGLEKNVNPVHVNPVELPAEAKAAISKGLSWIMEAQLPDGGWGAGTHAYQDVRDPHKVSADPATTALVCMSIVRTGSTLSNGIYSNQLQKATLFLVKSVEDWKESQPLLTTLTGTQPQTKLGQNIDAILTVQYFTNLLGVEPEHSWNERIRSSLKKCVQRIQDEQDVDGSWKGGGWAPVLQSALADNALESARDAGMSVDSLVMQRSKKYQKSNFDTATKSAVTGSAAGVVLYSLSSTNRTSAKEAKKAKDILQKAKKEGKVQADEKVSEISLMNAGISPAEARELTTAYTINEGTFKQATQADVMTGFGNNGGEEFLSYLMTGESVRLQGGNEWKQWYNMMLKRIITIQNADGSWEGHHCITSPVFCTATCLLILSIQNDGLPDNKAS